MTIDAERLPGLPEYRYKRLRPQHRVSLRRDRNLDPSFILRRYVDRALFLVMMCCVVGAAIVLWDLWGKIHGYA